MMFMVYVTTEWDYGLKTEVFVVRGDKGYAHTTDTILKEIGTRNTSVIDYFTVSFNVDVLRDIQNSKVVIYDNGEAIPVYMNDNIVEMIDWQQGGQSKNFNLKLGYGTEHKIYAKYLGNKKGLPSKSQTINISEPMPDLYGTLIERTTDTSQFEKEQSVSIPIRFTTNHSFESSDVKEIGLYVDGTLTTEINVTINAGATTGTGTFVLPNGLSAGLHNMEVRFDGDEHNESFSLPFKISVGYKLVVLDHSVKMINCDSPFENCNYVQCKVTDFLDNPINNVHVELHDADSWESGITRVFDQVTTNSEGIAYFNLFTPTSNNLGVAYHKNVKYYKSEAFTVPLIEISSIHMGAEKIIAEGYTSNVVVSITEYNGLSGETLDGIPVLFSNGLDIEKIYYTNSDGVANIPYSGANRGNTTLTATVGDINYTNTIEDISQLWSSVRGNINKECRILAPNFYELNNGFRFETRASNALSLVGFGDGELYEGSWSINFNVTVASPNLKVIAGSWFTSGESETWENLLQSNLVSLKNGQTVTISYTKQNGNGILKIELPGNVTNSMECNNRGLPMIGIISANANAQLTIDNVKFRRLD